MEKKLSKNPEKFGQGAIAGVAGPETANNAASGGAMVPLLTLGIPSSGTAAILMGALIMYNGKCQFRSSIKPIRRQLGYIYQPSTPSFFGVCDCGCIVDCCTVAAQIAWQIGVGQ